MAKPTVAQTKQMVEELLNLRTSYERYQELEKQIKTNLVTLKYKEIKIPGLGRVEIVQSERTTIPPALARDILGPLAEKVIQIKQSVNNSLIEAFVKVGDINEDQQERLKKEATKTPIISLYARPLK